MRTIRESADDDEDVVLLKCKYSFAF